MSILAMFVETTEGYVGLSLNEVAQINPLIDERQLLEDFSDHIKEKYPCVSIIIKKVPKPY